MAYLSAGYYVTRPAERAAYMSPQLPDKVLSASGCICDCFPNSWAIAWASVPDEERLEKAAAFGLSASRLPVIVDWATGSFSKDFGWPNSFYSLEAARAARAALLPADRNIVVIGLGLHEADAKEFLKAAEPPAQQPGFAPVGESGIFECVSGGTIIAGGGDFLGFELLASYLGVLTCSWLCNGLETELRLPPGVTQTVKTQLTVR